MPRPYTFVVLAVLLLIVGPLAALRTPTDIFPEIRIPIIAVVWGYTGPPPDEMSGRVMLQFERALTTTVNNIEHIEATSYTGVGIVKMFFQPGTDIGTANSQVTAISQTVIRGMPPNITPPLILNYNAATVPIVQLALSAKGMTEQAVFDLAINTVRTPLVTVPGAAIPWPFGGKFRQIQIDLDPGAMQARGLSANDVANALAAQNLLTPAGTQKIGSVEYAIQLNNAPRDYKDLADLPVFAKDGGIVTVRNTDVGALINADSSTGLALFVISDTQKLRLNVSVPQNYVPAVKINTKVQITVPEYPGKVYNAVVEASARSVDPASGSTRMQLLVDNAAGDLMPGAFANTHIELPSNMQALSVPAGALIFGQKGLRVATVDANNKVLLKPITIARDLGQVVEIATGITVDDRIIDSPPDGLSDGDPVRVIAPKEPVPKG